MHRQWLKCSRRSFLGAKVENRRRTRGYIFACAPTNSFKPVYRLRKGYNPVKQGEHVEICCSYWRYWIWSKLKSMHLLLIKISTNIQKLNSNGLSIQTKLIHYQSNTKKKHIPIERINNYQKYVSAWGILKIYMPQNIMMKKHDAALV